MEKEMKKLTLTIIGLLILTGCGKKENPLPLATIEQNQVIESVEISGSYIDGYNTEHVVGNETWVSTYNSSSSTYHILEFNNNEQYIRALNGDDTFSPGTYSLFEWVEVQGVLYYCQTAYDAESLESLKSLTGSDKSDPENGGCGDYGFPWTVLN